MEPFVAETQKVKREMAEQDRRISNAMDAIRTMITNIRLNPQIGELLAARGYDEMRLDEGLQLLETTGTSFNRRSAAITAQRIATASVNGNEKTARTVYADFRLTARGLFPNKETRSELALKGSVPEDRNEFLSIARNSINNARNEPYAARFSEFGYDGAMLDTINGKLDALTESNAAQNNTIIEAVQATKERDEAYAALAAWMKQFRKVAKAALRHDVELLKIFED